MRAWLHFLVATAACGRVGFDAVEHDASVDGISTDASLADATDASLADATGVDAVASATCTPGNLTTDFESGKPGWATIWEAPSANDTSLIFESGVVKGVPTESSTAAFTGITSSNFAMQNRRFVVETVRMVNTAVAAVAMISLDQGSSSPSIRIQQIAGMLNLSVNDGSSYDAISVPYDPIGHRFWQFREDNGTVFMETSADGVTFTTQRTLPTPLYVSTQVRLVFGAGSNELAIDPGEVHFDNLRDCGL